RAKSATPRDRRCPALAGGGSRGYWVTSLVPGPRPEVAGDGRVPPGTHHPRKSVAVGVCRPGVQERLYHVQLPGGKEALFHKKQPLFFKPSGELGGNPYRNGGGRRGQLHGPTDFRYYGTHPPKEKGDYDRSAEKAKVSLDGSPRPFGEKGRRVR